MKKVIRLLLILLLCCGLLMATGCNTEYKPQGDYSRFDTVFHDVEPPDQYIANDRLQFGSVQIVPSWKMLHGVGAIPVALVGEKLSSSHYYSATAESPVSEGTMEGYGFTLTRIRIKQVLLEQQEDGADVQFATGQLGEGDIITIKEYYTYQKDGEGNPNFYIADCGHVGYWWNRRTVQKEREYLFVLQIPAEGQDTVFESLLIEEMDEQVWQLQSEEDLQQMYQDHPIRRNGFYKVVLEILQKYRQEQ